MVVINHSSLSSGLYKHRLRSRRLDPIVDGGNLVCLSRLQVLYQLVINLRLVICRITGFDKEYGSKNVFNPRTLRPYII